MSDETTLPEGWTIRLLSDIAEINPATPVTLDDDTTVAFVPMRAVEPEGGGVLRPEIRRYGEVKRGYTSFTPNDVIMAKITPCMENGKLAVVPPILGEVCFGSTEFHVLRPAPGIAPDWIARFLLRSDVRREAQRQMGGAVGQMRVPAGFLESALIPVPPSGEQRRIADLVDEMFSDVDAGIAALEAAREKLKGYCAAVLKAAVDGTLTADWRAEHPYVEPASALLDRILAERRRWWEEEQLAKFAARGQVPPKNWKAKYTEPVAPNAVGLPELPAQWCWTSLDQLAEIAGGVTKGQKARPGQRMREIPYLRVANVQRGFLDLREIKSIAATEEDIESLCLVAGDVLFNEGGDRDKLGRGWIWNGEIDECIHQNHVFRARLFSQDVQPKLVSWCGNSYGQQWFMREGKQSVNLASINLTVLRSFPVPLAPAAEQEAIVELVEDQLSVVDHLEADLDAKLKQAQSLRQSILRHAFTGQLVPQDPNDEPASVLLERIAGERAARPAKERASRARQTVRTRA